ncbi:hypothetical protein SAMN04487840_10651 [Streptococcus gallolyticus]|uniref:Acetyltransferase, GNAT family n=1 Tax=Streptococcus gallolyticus TaxID=315405 RepID=A0A1H9QMN3_9STRE|nr:hypothetical protein SAMN04487840_10651 [Streptococcus gallolyticus]
MSEIKVEKVTLDKLSILQELSIQTFRENFAFDNTEEELQQFFDDSYTLEQLEKEVTDPESDVRFVLVDGREVAL